MKKSFQIAFVFSVLILVACKENPEKLSGSQLLEKVIEVHDPRGNWNNFSGRFVTQLTYADSSKKQSEISLNLPKSFFRLKEENDGIVKVLEIKNEKCRFTLNGSEEFTEKEREKHNLNCERAKWMRDYYTYTLGLPMKLRDPGTIVASKVKRTEFLGEQVLRFKVTYDQNIGKDTWYFYIDPDNYRLKFYQFFHDENANDGEYLVLSDEMVTYRGMRFPKVKKWYMNKDDTYLGADIIEEVKPIRK